MNSNGDANSVDWVNAVNSLLDGLIKDATSVSSSAASAPVATQHRQQLKASSPDLAKVEENGFVVAEKPHSPPRSQPQQQPKEPNCSSSGQVAELEGNRWYIRKAVNLTEPVTITPEAINQALAIEDSKKIVVKIDGKINAIIADKCNGLDMEVADVVANVELLGCNKVRLFLNGHVPTLVLDECETVQIYISASSKDIKILTSKCAEINVQIRADLFNGVLKGEEAEEYNEIPIPVQFVSYLDQSTGKLVTEAASHIGA